MPILRLAIPSPLRNEFDYLPPEGWTDAQATALQAGIRVRVPFGRREVTGYLLAVLPSSPLATTRLKAAIEILDHRPLINTAMVQLCRWAANYYQHPVGEVFPAAFPSPLRKGKAHKTLGSAAWRLTSRGKGLPAGALSRSPKQALALKILQQRESVPASHLASEGVSSGVLRSLREKGLIQAETLTLAHETATAGEPLTLNSDQARVVTLLKDELAGFSTHLLEGVTGSGKTEVYLHLIAHCLEKKQQVIILIPEIGLTPQTLGRFEQRFEANIVVLHSGLTEQSRYKAWEAARDGSAHIILGTRSAIFAPADRLGMIIVDEEHDSSYKQQDGFRYSARDIAVKRGQLENCLVLLGSATPSLESIYNVKEKRYRHHMLPSRAGGSELPSLQALDIRRQSLQAGLCTTLIESVEETLTAGHQVLLFLNRRGYAPTLQCHDCGWIAECRGCDARLTVHRRRGKLRCHHCGAGQPLPGQCPTCHSRSLMTAGLGTEQTEEFLRSKFTQWPIYRVDSDSMAKKNAMHDLVGELMKGEPCILLGTQMLTKGHHFPTVSLVAIIDVDSALFSNDFRGEERMAQLLTQVGGRAGRAGTSGRVILQTHYPDHPALQAILQKPYAEHAREILAGREATGMPPAGKLLMLRPDAADADTGEQFLQSLRTQAQSQLPPGTSLIGPLPSPMQRRAGKFRSQLMVTADSPKSAQAVARLLVSVAETLPVKRGMKWSIDVDPQDVF